LDVLVGNHRLFDSTTATKVLDLIRRQAPIDEVAAFN
jgi:hypothetical protein